ncbi:MAG: citrate/2-methylcitrate synthase, partial [Acidimicrobiales bacterium]
ALALLADHGLAASTFGARVAASVRADPYSVVATGLGIVGGTLHGAASGAVHDVLDEADRSGNVGLAVGEAHRRYGRNPGFGHTIYQTEDPRYHALMARVSDAWSEDARLATVHGVRDLVSERTDAVANVDLALGSLTWLAGMDRDAGEAIFAIARTAGWIAHALEEYEEQPLRFRPQARYAG